MTVRVVQPGLFTTVQDAGRLGWRRFGVPVSGAMDPLALGVANRLVFNPPTAPVLEGTMQGPVLEFAADALIAIAGGEVCAEVDGVPLPLWRPLFIRAGTRLSLERMRSGCRMYVAIAGGWRVPQVLGSASTYTRAGFGGFEGRPLRAGDVLEAGHPATGARVWVDRLRTLAERAGRAWAAPRWSASAMLRPAAGPLRVLPGPEWDKFTAEARDRLLNEAYRVTTQADRMGIRLSGPALTVAEPTSMLSEPVTPGTLQVPPDGQPIVLTADSQTTGGYPRLAVVIQADLPRLAQLVPGETVRFACVDEGVARAALTRVQQELRLLEAGLRLTL